MYLEQVHYSTVQYSTVQYTIHFGAGQAIAEAKLGPLVVRNLLWPFQCFQSTLCYNLKPTRGRFVTDSDFHFYYFHIC